MTTHTTRFHQLFFVVLCLFIGSGQAIAQKAKTNTKKAAAKESTPPVTGMIKDARPEAASTIDPNEPPASLYFILLEENDNKQEKVLSQLSKGFPDIQVKESSFPLLRSVGGDPEKLARVKKAFPEFLWLTPKQLATISIITQKVPELSNPEYLEKIGNK